ncbi:NADH:flavin oxidoreductase/NADH oxidase [Syncephalis fuscata]|nr:NADH:flavin oxidoreductase/NADH oxidase [Syncephalis fuscata]
MAATSNNALFQPLRVGAWSLQHRIALAPLTRRRATNNVQYSVASEYYTQRTTSGGLLITEATGISDTSLGDYNVPGIWTAEQRDAWKKTPDTVFIMQLWHRGRACHSDFVPNNQLPVAPSPIAITDALTQNKKGEQVPYEVPRELETNEIAAIIEDYRRASIYAKEAGFDGVEVHAANGYLINQFLESSTNKRSDKYGGSIENRVRFAVEVVQAAVDVFGSDRVGIRFSPYGKFGDMHDDNPLALYTEAIRAVTQLNIAYVHLVEPRIAGSNDTQDTTSVPDIELLVDEIRKSKSTVIRAGGYKADSAREVVEANRGDLIAFGRSSYSYNQPFTPYNRATFYTPGREGYTDYPIFSAS